MALERFDKPVLDNPLFRRISTMVEDVVVPFDIMVRTSTVGSNIKALRIREYREGIEADNSESQKRYSAFRDEILSLETQVTDSRANSQRPVSTWRNGQMLLLKENKLA